MIDVLLICPKADRPFHDKYIPLSPPLGLAYLGKALKMMGITFKILDLYCIAMSLNEIYQLFLDEKPKMVGFMVYSESVNATYCIAKAAKKANPYCLTIAGGPHATFKSEEMLQGHDEIDITIMHEGEESIVELWEQLNCSYPKYGMVKGICYKEEEKIIHNATRKPIHDLDKYGYPDRSWFPNIQKYLEPSTIISSRGCPGQCAFCGGANISGGVYRKRSIDSVLEELDYLGTLFPDDVTIFWDDAFGYDTKRLMQLCNEMIKKPRHYWSCGLRVDRTSYELLEYMKRAGCVKINFGVESGSQVILNGENKGITLEQVKAAVGWAKQLDIYNSCSMMIGHPQDTEETMKKTINFAEELLNNGATSCTFNALTPFPGTYVYENREKLGIKLITNDWEKYNFLNPVFETPNISVEQIRKYLIGGLMLWGKYKNNRNFEQDRLNKRDAILLGDFLGRNVQV